MMPVLNPEAKYEIDGYFRGMFSRVLTDWYLLPGFHSSGKLPPGLGMAIDPYLSISA